MAKKKRASGIVSAATEAAQEIAQAAGAFRDSWEHVQNARSKAKPATRAAARAGKKVLGAAKRGVSRLRGKANRAVSRTKAAAYRRKK